MHEMQRTKSLTYVVKANSTSLNMCRLYGATWGAKTYRQIKDDFDEQGEKPNQVWFEFN